MDINKKIQSVRLSKAKLNPDIKTYKEMWVNGQPVKKRTYGHSKTQIHQRVHLLSWVSNSAFNANRITFIAFDRTGKVNLGSKLKFTG